MYDRHTEPIEVAEKAFKILVLTGWLFYIYVDKHENKRQIKPWKTITTFLIVVPYGTVSFWHYTTLDGARLGQVHQKENYETLA